MNLIFWSFAIGYFSAELKRANAWRIANRRPSDAQVQLMEHEYRRQRYENYLQWERMSDEERTEDMRKYPM